MNSPKDEKKPIDHESAKRTAEWAQHMHPTGTGFRDVCDAYLDLAAQVESLKQQLHGVTQALEQREDEKVDYCDTLNVEVEEHFPQALNAMVARAKAGDLLRERLQAFAGLPGEPYLTFRGVQEDLLLMLEETDPEKLS